LGRASEPPTPRRFHQDYDIEGETFFVAAESSRARRAWRNESVLLPELLLRIRGEQHELTDAAAVARDYRDTIELSRAREARSRKLRAAANVAVPEARASASWRPPVPHR
jgi:hypothetical protein